MADLGILEKFRVCRGSLRLISGELAVHQNVLQYFAVYCSVLLCCTILANRWFARVFGVFFRSPQGSGRQLSSAHDRFSFFGLCFSKC